MDLYEILEVSPNASSEVIKNAYKALAKKYHPDMNSGNKEYAEEQMKKINYAYEVLSDNLKRAQYDKKIRRNEYRQSSSKSTYTEQTYSKKENNTNNEYNSKKTHSKQSQAKDSSTPPVFSTEEHFKSIFFIFKFIAIVFLIMGLLFFVIFDFSSKSTDKSIHANNDSYYTKANDNVLENTLESNQVNKGNTIPTQITIIPTIKINPTAKIKVNKNPSQKSKPTVKKAEDNKTKVTNAGYLTLGSSREDVKKVMGAPTSIINKYNGESWSYNFSNIEFDNNGKVSGWFENGTKLKVTIGNKKPNASEFTKGSSKEDVVKAMGTPTSISQSYNGESWSYNFSNVEFDSNGKVFGWFENGTKLKVTIGNKDPNASAFTKGSSMNDVIKAMGTPTSVRNTYNGESWSYNFSNVEFSNGKVSGWFENGTKLKVK